MRLFAKFAGAIVTQLKEPISKPVYALMRSSAFLHLLATGLVIVGSLSVAELARAVEIPESYFATFRFSGGERERTALTREIDRVADQFGFFIRGIARRRMHAEIRPEGVITVARRDGVATFQFDDRLRVVCDGDFHRAVGANDEQGTGQCSYGREALRFNERYDEGRTYHTLTLSADGRTLRMAVRITHPQLPDDLRYRLTYTRR